MITNDLYRVKAESIVEARWIVESALGVSMVEGDSEYRRGVYFRANGGYGGSEALLLVVNLDPYDDVPNEDAFPEAKFLLYVNGTSRSAVLRELFETNGGAVQLLRSQQQ